MITKQELQKYAKQQNMTLAQAEKNYLHIKTLHAISIIAPDKIIFKGGTALMICHGLNRFSEDLDFTANKETNINKIFNEIKNFFKEQEINIEIKQIETTKISQKCTFQFQGPLYQGTQQTTSKIEIDISLREKIILPTDAIRIIHNYKDTPSFYIQTMNLNEILAEKIRAIMTREKSRDLFDTEYLIEKKIPINKKLINEKLKYYNKQFAKKELEQAINNKKRIWQPELNNLTKNLPDFNKTKEKILEQF